MGEGARKRILGALGLCLAGAVVAGLLLLQHHGEAGAVSAVNQVCGDGKTSGCETVARSAWSKVGGVPLAAVGLFFYCSLVLLLALATLAPAEARDGLVFLVAAALALALLVDLLLLGLQAFSIHAFCKLCLVTYALNALALALLWPARRAAGAIAPAVRGPEGRLALAGWVLGSLGFAGAVLGAESALVQREATRATNVLGAPAPAPAPSAPTTTTPGPPVPAVASPTPVAAASTAPPPGGDLKYYQEQARHLQEILDDPQKLSEYFTAKAAKEYEKAPVQKLDLKDTPFKGPANAPVQVVEFSDFLCPFCRNIAAAFAQFIPQSGNRVVVYFKNYPLDKDCNPAINHTAHVGACVVALGGICANYQGKFQAYHDRVFGAELHEPKAQDVVRLGGEAGLNTEALESCLTDPRTKEQLAAQIEEGRRVGVQATPTLLINGRKLPRVEDFVATVDKEARAKGFPPMAEAKAK